MASSFKFYNCILFYTKDEEFVEVSNDYHLHKTQFSKEI